MDEHGFHDLRQCLNVLFDVDETDLRVVAHSSHWLYDVEWLGNIQAMVFYLSGLEHEVCDR